MPPEKRVFTIILEGEDDGGYSVYCPALPGCVSQGDDRSEALENIKEAIALVLEVLADESEVKDGQALHRTLPYHETPDMIAQEIKCILANREEDGLPYEGVSIEQVNLVIGAPV